MITGSAGVSPAFRARTNLCSARCAGGTPALPVGEAMNLYDRIPNNVNLSEDKKLQRALEKWLPNYLDWWNEMGPEGFQGKDVYLRTAVSVEPDASP